MGIGLATQRIHPIPGGDRNAVQEYRKVNDQAWIEQCMDWCMASGPDKGKKLVQKIFRDNPRLLWQYETS
jgi:hypothetical protein